MAGACIFADDTWDPAALFAIAGRRWSLVRMGPSKLNQVLRDLQDSVAYSNLLEKPGDWVAPPAIAPLSKLADGLPCNASTATTAEGPGKGGKGDKGAFMKKVL